MGPFSFGSFLKARHICLIVYDTLDTQNQFSFISDQNRHISCYQSRNLCVCHNSHDHSHASYFSSVFLSMHGGHRPCGAGAEFGRPAELWQGFVPHSQSSPSLYLGHASPHCLALFDLHFFALNPSIWTALLFPKQSLDTCERVGFR